jgi:SAM-dependent methyltransferase
MQSDLIHSGQADYGIDAPPVIRGFALTAATGFGLAALVNRKSSLWRRWLALTLNTASALPAVLAISMLYYGRRGKFRLRDRMLEKVEWRGNESVLDIGTGRGLLAIGAAHKLVSGCAIGIDIERPGDLSGNTLAAARENAEREGVPTLVDFRYGDAVSLPFPDENFDVVYSLLCLHNIEPAADRTQACREIVRVLKPGGVAVIGDFPNAKSYEAFFRDAGLRTELEGSLLTAGGLAGLLIARRRES